MNEESIYSRDGGSISKYIEILNHDLYYMFNSKVPLLKV